MPARPFLAPVAAEMGEEVARAVAAAVVAALRGDSPDAGSARVDLCGDGLDGSDPLGGGALASTSSAKAPGAGGHARPVAHQSNTDGLGPSGVRLASEPNSAGSSGQQPTPTEPGTETPSSVMPGSHPEQRPCWQVDGIARRPDPIREKLCSGATQSRPRCRNYRHWPRSNDGFQDWRCAGRVEDVLRWRKSNQRCVVQKAVQPHHGWPRPKFRTSWWTRALSLA